MTWDAREWVASVVGCKPDDLSILNRDESRSGTQVRYARDGEQVARVIVNGPLRPLDGTPGGHWVVALQLADQSTQTREDIPDSATIQF